MDNSIQKKDGTILSVRNLAVDYVSDDETVHAVNDISFELQYGQTLGLVGETGAGKTTVAKAIMRILPERQSRVRSGQVIVDGEDVFTYSEDKMRHMIRGKKISMVFQDPMTALNPVMRVGKQIAEAVQIHEHCSKRAAEDRAMEMLELVGIPVERSREYPHQFSGGMKQRVIIAIALACNPDLLIADEPTSALDVTIQAQVLDMINELKRVKNMAMILITHDFGLVAESCDYVGVVYAGQIIEYGSKQQIFKNACHPYTRGLFDAIPSTSTDIDRLHPIIGLPPDPTNLPQGCYFSPRCPYADAECKRGHIPIIDKGNGHLCRCIHPIGRDARQNPPKDEV